jgi:hypothetical protein|tara:strand:+ start:532 stop:753 length:222 start_codon:yes stop_codon:yes gene_type:complete
MIAVTLTLSALISLLFLGLGGVIGWLAKDVVNQKNTAFYPMHPEFLDEDGNIIADEIMSVRFENPEELGEDHY